MSGNRTPGQDLVQSGNFAGGHLAGGNISIEGGTTLHVAGNYAPQIQSPQITSLSRLYKRLREEVTGDPELTDYIDQLQIFTRSVEDEEIIGLDGKLAAANRADQLDMAKAMKELIYGQLRKNMFSKTFQTIYATLMGKIYEEFQTWVRPAIASATDRTEIDLLVNIHVVRPIVAELEVCPDYDGTPIATVRGMIYFLTGNCHLRWH